MADELTVLRRQRGGNIGYVKRIISESNTVISDAAIGDEEKETTLLANKEILCEKKQTIQEIHEKILPKLVEENDINDEITTVSDCFKDVGKVVFAINKWIEKKCFSVKVPASPSPIPTPTHTRLPKLVLSNYDGDPLMYQSFWDNFESTVHKNKSLDEVSKFNYLKGLLEGEAGVT